MFYFVIFDEIILSNKIGKDYHNIEATLKNKIDKTVQKIMSHNNNDELMQIDLMAKMLKLVPSNRLSIQKIMQHPLFWDANTSILFIYAIRKKFDIIKCKFLNEMKINYQNVLREIQKKFKMSDPKFAREHKKALQQIKKKIYALDIEFERKIRNEHDHVMQEIQEKLEKFDLKFVNIIDYPNLLQEVRNQIDIFGTIGKNQLTTDQEESFRNIKKNVYSVNFNLVETDIKEVLELIKAFETSTVGKLTVDKKKILNKIKKGLRSLDVRPSFANGIEQPKIEDIIVLLDIKFLDDIMEKHKKIIKDINEKFLMLDVTYRDQITKNYKKFVFEIKSKFNMEDAKFVKKSQYQYQLPTKNLTAVNKLIAALDEKKSVVNSDWKAQLDPTLAKEFNEGYDKEKVSELLRAMRNKVIIILNPFILSKKLISFHFQLAHFDENKDSLRMLLGSTSSEFLNYFTLRFPQLMIHCYNTVDTMDTDAKEYFKDCLNQDHGSDDDSHGSPGGSGKPDGKPNEKPFKKPDGSSGSKPDGIPDGKPDGKPNGNHDGDPNRNPDGIPNTNGVCLRLSKLTISCNRDTTFPHAKIYFDSLVLRNISHIFVQGKKSFTNFLQNNGSLVKQLEFSYGFLKFESLNEILQKLPSLQEIIFDEIKYQVLVPKKTIDQATCKSLIKLVIRNSDMSSMLQETFKQYINIKADITDLKGSKLITKEEMNTTSQAKKAVEASSTEPSTSRKKNSEERPELKHLKSQQLKPFLEALNEDGSIDMDMLKRICQGCLKGLKEKHAAGIC